MWSASLSIRHSTALACALAAIACSSSDELPLGGPHGGGSNLAVAPGAPSVTSDAAPSSAAAGDGGAEASAPPSTGCTPAAAPATAPTFTAIYTKYFAPGAPADCATGGACHAQFKTEAGAWSFLLQYGQVGTTPPELTDPNASWLVWYGGLMPETGTPCNPQAMADLNAWAAAGGKND